MFKFDSFGFNLSDSAYLTQVYKGWIGYNFIRDSFDLKSDIPSELNLESEFKILSKQIAWYLTRTELDPIQVWDLNKNHLTQLQDKSLGELDRSTNNIFLDRV